jgi:hypothetical protein
MASTAERISSAIVTGAESFQREGEQGCRGEATGCCAFASGEKVNCKKKNI